MNTVTKIWTYGVAYLSLAVGSGVSIAGNIADTYRVALVANRVVDGLDIGISTFWPAAVLLAIEMFVSRLWSPKRGPQVLRWLGSIGIGFVAMYVSWHHLADLLASRGQDDVVATLGPLAIDGLAIMATGLILSSRGHKPLAKIEDVALATQPMAPEWTVADQAMLDAFEVDMARLDAAIPVSPAPALARSNEVKPESVPESAVILFRVWDGSPKGTRPSATDRNTLLAGEFGVSPRTVRRWYEASTKVTL